MHQVTEELWNMERTYVVRNLVRIPTIESYHFWKHKSLKSNNNNKDLVPITCSRRPIKTPKQLHTKLMFGWEESGGKGSRWNESEEKRRDILFFDWLDGKKREKGF